MSAGKAGAICSIIFKNSIKLILTCHLVNEAIGAAFAKVTREFKPAEGSH